jgi:hypothetical protein
LTFIRDQFRARILFDWISMALFYSLVILLLAIDCASGWPKVFATGIVEVLILNNF